MDRICRIRKGSLAMKLMKLNPGPRSADRLPLATNPAAAGLLDHARRVLQWLTSRRWRLRETIVCFSS